MPTNRKNPDAILLVQGLLGGAGPVVASVPGLSSILGKSQDFFRVLNIPAVQLIKKEGVRKIFKNGKNDVLVITAHQWLALLP